MKTAGGKIALPSTALLSKVQARVPGFMSPPSVPPAAGAQPMVAMATPLPTTLPVSVVPPPPSQSNPVGYQSESAPGPSSMPVSVAPAQAATDAPAAEAPKSSLPMMPILLGVGALLFLMSSRKHAT